MNSHSSHLDSNSNLTSCELRSIHIIFQVINWKEASYSVLDVGQPCCVYRRLIKHPIHFYANFQSLLPSICTSVNESRDIHIVFFSLCFGMFYLGAFRLILDQIRAEFNWIIYEHTAGEADLNSRPQSSEWREILIYRLNLLPTGFRLVRDLYLSSLKPISFTPSQVAGPRHVCASTQVWNTIWL